MAKHICVRKLSNSPFDMRNAIPDYSAEYNDLGYWNTDVLDGKSVATALCLIRVPITLLRLEGVVPNTYNPNSDIYNPTRKSILLSILRGLQSQLYYNNRDKLDHTCMVR